VRCIEAHAALDPSAALDKDEIERLVDHWSFELYIAEASELALLFYENPDVLFVIAAGNEDWNNDKVLPYPAYLSRFFPNVTTVAATNADDTICNFSNYGVDSVNIGAPGRDIRSTIIPETPCYMNGTSMAAPHVAGVAAYVRAVAPKLTAAELRQLIDYSSRDVEQLHRYTTAGGVIDKGVMHDLHLGNEADKAAAHARIAINSALLNPRAYPRQAVDADLHSKEAIRLAPKSAEAWRARSITLARAGQFEAAIAAIDRALEIEPGFEPGWFHRAELYVELEDAMGVIRSLDKSIALLAAEGEGSNILRSLRLVMRAGVYHAIGESDAARQDLILARTLNSGILLTEELEALLPRTE
jgi:tetratricopeptide (TPR) repeat protein